PARRAGVSTLPPRSAMLSNWRVIFPLLFCMGLILVLAFLVFRHFLLTFTVALSLALLLGPAHRRLTARMGGRRGLSAAVLVLLALVAVLLPLLTYTTLLIQQAADVVEWLKPRLAPIEVEKLWSITLPKRYPLLMAWVRQLTGGGTGMASISAAMGRFASGANQVVQVAVTSMAGVFIDLGLFVLMLFFLLRDGDDLRESLRGISPLTRGQEVELTEHLTRTVRGVLMSMVVVPVCQGLVALPAFWLFGVPKPHLWSLMVVFAAVIPILGSPLAWVPAGLYLLLTGATGKGIGLLIYGAVIISGIDNVIKPMILKGAAQIHMMFAFLSILGGVYAFGPKGIIVGPMVLSLVLSAYRIYRYDVLRWRTLPAPSIPPAEEPAPLLAGGGGG
ncbi:MAG TPA: AI-2E family transporter, partial [Vicinamibacteria bacterium]|nr:AI-2E family transporter [Vicinamibacteria bacterium]